ncbi:MAG: hypothetical protein ACJ8G1_15955 [Vitreoscilla sp.]
MIRSVFAAGMLAVALAPVAHASSTADAVLSDFHIDLLDLAPADGVAPSLAFSPGTTSVASAANVSPGASEFWQQRGSTAFAPVSSSGSLFGNGGSASFSGDPAAGGATLAAHAFGGPGFGNGGGAAQAYVDNQPDGDISFVLSPRTQVTFSGLAALDWRASDPRAAAAAEVQLQFWQFADGNFVTLASDDFVRGWQRVPGDPQAGSDARPVAITFANTTDAAVTLDYVLQVFASASEDRVPVSPVDEPGGAWLLLAGALPLAWAARRRGLSAGRAALCG